MSTISIRLSDDEAKLIREYTKINEINMSTFIRDLILDKIEEDLLLDEKRILEARKKIEKEEIYSSEEFWKRFDL